MQLTGIEQFFYNNFSQAFGSVQLAGLFALFFFIVVGAFLGIDVGVFVVILIPLVAILTTYGLLPGGPLLFFVILVAGAVVIAMAFRRNASF